MRMGTLWMSHLGAIRVMKDVDRLSTLGVVKEHTI